MAPALNNSYGARCSVMPEGETNTACVEESLSSFGKVLKIKSPVSGIAA